MLEELIEKIQNTSSVKELRKLQLEFVKELLRLAREYAAALNNFASTVQAEKEDGYKKSISECVYRAGALTGYSHERIKVEIEAVKTLIALISDMVSDFQKSVDTSSLAQPDSEAT